MFHSKSGTATHIHKVAKIIYIYDSCNNIFKNAKYISIKFNSVLK